MRIGPRAAGPLALAALAGASILSYVRVFAGATTAWLLPALLAAWLPIALVLGLRRAGLRRWAAALLTLAAGVAYVALVVGARTPPPVEPTLPTGSWPPAGAGRLIAGAWGALATTFTPVVPGPGLLGLLLCAAWASGVASALCTGDGPPLAAHPWIVLFVFAAAVGTSRGRHLLLVAFLAALLAVLYGEAWARTARRTPPAGQPPGIRAAAASAAVAVVAAAAVPSVASAYLEGGPRLGTESSSTTVISPIVQILPRLNDRAPRVLFTVDADRPSYWKLASLDRFDGNAWSTAGEYRPVRSAVILDERPGGRSVALTQTYTIEGLGGVWVPAAYAPSRVSGITVSADPVRATLATPELRRGERYTVVSLTPSPTPDLLRRAGTRGAPEGSTQLPGDLPPVIGQLAAQVAGTAGTAYDQALAIQSFLRMFKYSQDVPPGHSESYLVHFLTEVRSGYCEQFAGSMAVMLRTLGIPARVAVGFLPGLGAHDGFVVSNEEAHAWPEVWFHDVGWVPFEPTPRAGVAPAAYANPPGPGPDEPGADEPTAPGSPAEPGGLSSRPPGGAASPGDLGGPSAGGPAGSPEASVVRWMVLIATLGALLTAARAVRLRAWTLRPLAPAQRILSAWHELLLRGADAWRPRREAETEQEYARAMVDALGIDYALASPLVLSRQRAAYAPGAPSEEDARAAAASLRVLRRRLLRAAGWKARLKLLLSPRPLLVRRRLL